MSGDSRYFSAVFLEIVIEFELFRLGFQRDGLDFEEQGQEVFVEESAKSPE